jgi:hypothetical protein
MEEAALQKFRAPFSAVGLEDAGGAPPMTLSFEAGKTGPKNNKR